MTNTSVYAVIFWWCATVRSIDTFYSKGGQWSENYLFSISMQFLAT